jgi:hypothetical protein
VPENDPFQKSSNKFFLSPTNSLPSAVVRYAASYRTTLGCDGSDMRRQWHLLSSEIRPIIGWHLGKFDFIVNPIFDNSWKGFNNLDFAPATRIAYNLSQTWAVAVEEYADFGIIKHFLTPDQQLHQLFGVIGVRRVPNNTSNTRNK